MGVVFGGWGRIGLSGEAFRRGVGIWAGKGGWKKQSAGRLIEPLRAVCYVV